jgi:hypothetical protein
VTIADYSDIERMGKEKAKTCPPTLYSHEIHGLKEAPLPPRN